MMERFPSWETSRRVNARRRLLSNPPWRLMKPRHTLTAPPGRDDEVARQRRKRAEALLDRPVADFDELTLRDVLMSVLAANEESQGPFDVDRFLTERGHAWQTVEMVLASLELFDRHPSSPRSRPRP